MTADPSGLQVIGAGLMRTGTYSLHLALEKLLDGKCYHMKYAGEEEGHIDFWLSAIKKDPSEQEWKTFFKDFRAAVDFPEVAFYRQLVDIYPSAKVVLTVRDTKSWVTSVNNTIKKALSTGVDRKFEEMADGAIRHLMGNVDFEDEEEMIKVFNKHTQEVKEIVPADRLLVFEIKQGWKPLCEFLQLPVPDVPFPFTNTTQDFLAMLDEGNSSGVSKRMSYQS